MAQIFHIIVREERFNNDKMLIVVATDSDVALTKLGKHPHYHRFLPEPIEVFTEAEYKEKKLTGWVVFYQGKYHKLHCRILAKDCDEAEEKFKIRFPNTEITRSEAERKKTSDDIELDSDKQIRVGDLRATPAPA